MDFRLFPHPSNDLCTPFAYDNEIDGYARFHLEKSHINLVLINRDYDAATLNVHGCDEVLLIGSRRPNRDKLLDYLFGLKTVNHDFLAFVTDTYVLPTFPMSREEAFVKTIIKQIISAKQAKQMFSNFVKKYGYRQHNVYGFPSTRKLRSLSVDDFREFGLGLKAERMYSGLEAIKTLNASLGGKVRHIKGIGPWSRQILDVELQRDYSYYPFWDKSGDKIKRVCGVDIVKQSIREKKVAADLYIYAASYIEFIR